MRTTIAFVAAVALLGLAPAAQGGHDTDSHSDNMSLLANWDDGGAYRQGSDLAFWGRTAVLGNYDNPGGFVLMDVSRRRRPEPISRFRCPGPQNDVSIWRDLVVLSVDSARSGPECGAGGASAAQTAAGQAWEGVRVVSIADRAEPVQVAAVDTDCGSHTHTLVPDVRRADPRLLVYVLSYPLSGQGVDCNIATHRKISVVEVPLDDPAAAKVVSTPDVSPAVGCHDVTVYPEKGIAAAACLTETQLWDISDPVTPKVISHIRNPAIQIHHSTTFSWDGRTVVIGDEMGGALAAPGCLSGGEAPTGALWFYDATDPVAPVEKGWFVIPRNEPDSAFCTAHNFNTVPLRSGRDVLVSAWYNGGTTVVDFTDPANPVELGHYTPQEGGRAAAWSSYWYNGLVYSNNFDEDVHSTTAHSRGFDVLSIRDPALRDAVDVPRLNPQTMERPRGVR